MEVDSAKQEGNPLFPVFLKLNQLHIVLIGAGPVGLEKLSAILQNCPEAKVTIIALTVIPEVYEFASEFKGVIIIQRSFINTDLDGADIVFAATNNPALNDFIRVSAHRRKLLVNIADKPELCDFYLGSIVQKGDLKIAISTNGKSPTIAKRLKEVLNEGLTDDINSLLQQMCNLRQTLTGDFAEKVKELNRITSVLIKESKLKEDNTSPYLIDK